MIWNLNFSIIAKSTFVKYCKIYINIIICMYELWTENENVYFLTKYKMLIIYVKLYEKYLIFKLNPFNKGLEIKLNSSKYSK